MSKIDWKSNEQIDQEEQAQKAEAFRRERDTALRETDWTQLPDSPLSVKDKATYAAYRVGLRNAPGKTPVDFLAGEEYSTGTLVNYKEELYIVIKPVVAGDAPDDTNYRKLGRK